MKKITIHYGQCKIGKTNMIINDYIYKKIIKDYKHNNIIKKFLKKLLRFKKN